MIKRTALLMTTAFMFVTLPGAAVAGDQDRDQLKDKQQLKDGSCLDYTTDLSGVFTLAADQAQDRLKDGTGDGPDRDRLKDGSCLDYSTDMGGSFTLAADRIRDQKKDGSCLDGDYSTDLSGVFTLAADQAQDRLKDGTGDGPDRDRLKDGSCLDYSTDVSGSFTLAADRIRDQKKDGSCLDGDYNTDSVNMILAARQRDKDNIKDKLKDCKGNG